MLIGIEAERANLGQKTGVEHYAKQLILHLAKIDSKNQYVLYLRTRPQDWLKTLPQNFRLKVMPFPVFWTQARISWEMFRYPVNALLVPASALPLIHPKNSAVTIHDIAWKFFPETFTWFNRNFLEYSSRFALKSGAKVIAVSNATKNDLIKFYNVDGTKITVIHHGWEERQLTVNDSQLTLPEKYVLFLSTLQPRKNLEGLIDAFKLLKSQCPQLPHKLVVAGKLGWKFGPILKKIQTNKDSVIYLSHVSDGERFDILKRADLLVLPSFYEGFGMQILEAFAAFVPVACSNVSSLPEVAGGAAVYFDPHNIADISRAMKMVLLDKSLADSLRQKGTERLKNFSWEKCARETLDVLTSGELSS